MDSLKGQFNQLASNLKEKPSPRKSAFPGRNTISVVNTFFNSTGKRLNQETLNSFKESQQQTDYDWTPDYTKALQRRKSEGGMNLQMSPNDKSAFSHMYLDDRTKDLLSIKNYRNGYDPSVLSQNTTVYLNRRESTIHAPTLIERLQDDINQAKKGMNHSRSPRQWQGKDDRLLLSRVMAALQSYQTDLQKLNGLRYECMRQVGGQTHLINRQHFLSIYKNYGIHLPLEQQADLMDFLALDAPPNTVNIKMLSRIFQVTAKIQYNKLRQTDNLVTPPISQLQNCAQNIS